MAADAGELRARATLDNTEFLGALKDMVSQIQQNSEAAAAKIDNITGALGKVGEAVEGLAISDKIIEFGKDCLDAAIAVNKLHDGFIALTGSTEESEAAFEKIHDLSLHSMFDFADTLAPAAKQMVLLGMSADQAANTMTALVTAATALRQGPEWINEVTSTIDNMQAHIVASSRDMKALSQEGISAWSDLATSLGVSIAEAQKMVKEGAVTSQQVIAAVTTDLMTRSEAAAEVTRTSWSVSMHALSQYGEDAKEALGQSILKILTDFKPVLDEINNAIQTGITWWKGLSEPVQEVILAIGAAIPIIVGISGAIAALTVIDLGAFFAAPVAAIVALVTALALIGKWIYDEWPAIKAVFLVLWKDITDAWGSTVSKLANLFSPLVAIWKAEWNGLVTALKYIWSVLMDAVSATVDAIGKAVSVVVGFMTGMPGGQEIAKLGNAWNVAQKQIDDAAAATKAHTATLAAEATATAQAKQKQDEKNASDLAASNIAKTKAAEQAKADAAAKKAADEQKKYNEDLEKTYTALAAVAPDVADQFAAMYGGISKSAVDAQKVMGSAWATASDATRQTVQDTLALGEAYKTLGITNSAVLEAAVGKTEAAYTAIQASGTASAGDLAKAFDAIVAANQKVADSLNTDVKDAYTAGKITATDYWDTVVERAAEAVDEAKAAYEDGFATEQDVAAKEKILLADRTAAFNKQQADYTTAMNAIGDKTSEQLGDATAQWTLYAANIAQKLGVDSKGYIDAQIKLTQSLIEQYTGLGKAVPDTLTAQLKGWQQKLEDAKPPADQLSDAMKTLGATSTAGLTVQLNAAADALVKVQNLQKSGLATSSDVAVAQNKVSAIVGQMVTQYNDQFTPAVQKNDQSQQTAATNLYQSAVHVQQSLTAVGNTAEATAAIQTAAAKQSGDDYQRVQLAALKTVEDEWKTLGLTIDQQLTESAAKAQAAYNDIATSGTASAVQLQEAWVANQKIQLNTALQLGGQVTEDQKNQLAAQQQNLQNHLDITTSQWKTAYDGIKSAVSTTFDDLTKKIVTGDGSFSAIVTTMWQSIAESAIKGFLEPVTKAIENFIATTIANLLSGQGLGGVLDSLTAIGKSVSGLFSGAPGGLATSASTMGTVGQAIPGIEGAATTGTSAATSAATSVAGSLTSTLGAIGSIGSFIAGAIGDIQNIHMANVMGQVESNTRYSALYLGGRSDQGILGILFTIHEEMAWGTNTQATEKLRDLFLDFSGPALDSIQGIRQILEGWGSFITDIRDVLFDIRDIATGLGNTITSGFNNLTVTINAGNLTTADAARALGDQIAKNLTTQMVSVQG